MLERISTGSCFYLHTLELESIERFELVVLCKNRMVPRHIILSIQNNLIHEKKIALTPSRYWQRAHLDLLIRQALPGWVRGADGAMSLDDLLVPSMSVKASIFLACSGEPDRLPCWVR